MLSFLDWARYLINVDHNAMFALGERFNELTLEEKQSVREFQRIRHRFLRYFHHLDMITEENKVELHELLIKLQPVALNPYQQHNIKWLEICLKIYNAEYVLAQNALTRLVDAGYVNAYCTIYYAFRLDYEGREQSLTEEIKIKVKEKMNAIKQSAIERGDTYVMLLSHLFEEANRHGDIHGFVYLSRNLSNRIELLEQMAYEIKNAEVMLALAAEYARIDQRMQALWTHRAILQAQKDKDGDLLEQIYKKKIPLTVWMFAHQQIMILENRNPGFSLCHHEDAFTLNQMLLLIREALSEPEPRLPIVLNPEKCLIQFLKCVWYSVSKQYVEIRMQLLTLLGERALRKNDQKIAIHYFLQLDLRRLPEAERCEKVLAWARVLSRRYRAEVLSLLSAAILDLEVPDESELYAFYRSLGGKERMDIEEERRRKILFNYARRLITLISAAQYYVYGNDMHDLFYDESLFGAQGPYSPLRGESRSRLSVDLWYAEIAIDPMSVPLVGSHHYFGGELLDTIKKYADQSPPLSLQQTLCALYKALSPDDYQWIVPHNEAEARFSLRGFQYGCIESLYYTWVRDDSNNINGINEAASLLKGMRAGVTLEDLFLSTIPRNHKLNILCRYLIKLDPGKPDLHLANHPDTFLAQSRRGSTIELQGLLDKENKSRRGYGTSAPVTGMK